MEEKLMEVNEPDFSYGGIYTYADYLKWTIEERVELIKGKIFRMSPAPNRMHQAISLKLTLRLGNFLDKRPCQLFTAPFDVRLPRKSKNDEDIITVVQPDLVVVCDPDKLDDKGCVGAPDIVIEILSPSSSKKELHNKYEVYEEAGVKEYWVVFPLQNVVSVYTLVNDVFQPSRLLTDGDKVTTPILPGFVLDIGELFRDL